MNKLYQRYCILLAVGFVGTLAANFWGNMLHMHGAPINLVQVVLAGMLGLAFCVGVIPPSRWKALFLDAYIKIKVPAAKGCADADTDTDGGDRQSAL
jgi:hypothetical protein